MVKWEYSCLEASRQDRDRISETVDVLNAHGQDGWELAAWVSIPSSREGLWGWLLLKRPLPTSVSV